MAIFGASPPRVLDWFRSTEPDSSPCKCTPIASESNAVSHVGRAVTAPLLAVATQLSVCITQAEACATKFTTNKNVETPDAYA
jgi:hypothetical protein